MKHPAKFSKKLMPIFIEATEGYEWVLDPFAGVGGVHELSKHGHITRGVEIEPEWAYEFGGNINAGAAFSLDSDAITYIGNSMELDGEDGQFDAIVTSPCYGNRMADHHEAKDDSKRNTYRHTLGRVLDPFNAGQLQWSAKKDSAYKHLHETVWAESVRVLRPGGRFVLNIKDHIRQHQRQFVSGWHVSTLSRLGLDLLYHVEVPTKGLKQGSNRDVRAGHEMVYVFEKSS